MASCSAYCHLLTTYNDIQARGVHYWVPRRSPIKCPNMLTKKKVHRKVIAEVHGGELLCFIILFNYCNVYPFSD